MRTRGILFGTLALMAVSSFGVGSPQAQAAEFRHDRRIVSSWHQGHWAHDRHEGRLGWWWVVGPAWHYYERPNRTVIIEQAPPAPAPVTVIQAPAAPAPSPVLYYCKATGTQYPETMTCPGGWLTMTADTPPQP